MLTVTRMDLQKGSANFTFRLPDDYINLKDRAQLEAMRRSSNQKIPHDTKEVSHEDS